LSPTTTTAIAQMCFQLFFSKACVLPVYDLSYLQTECQETCSAPVIQFIMRWDTITFIE